MKLVVMKSIEHIHLSDLAQLGVSQARLDAFALAKMEGMHKEFLNTMEFAQPPLHIPEEMEYLTPEHRFGYLVDIYHNSIFSDDNRPVAIRSGKTVTRYSAEGILKLEFQVGGDGYIRKYFWDDERYYLTTEETRGRVSTCERLQPEAVDVKPHVNRYYSLEIDQGPIRSVFDDGTMDIRTYDGNGVCARMELYQDDDLVTVTVAKGPTSEVTTSQSSGYTSVTEEYLDTGITHTRDTEGSTTHICRTPTAYTKIVNDTSTSYTLVHIYDGLQPTYMSLSTPTKTNRLVIVTGKKGPKYTETVNDNVVFSITKN